MALEFVRRWLFETALKGALASNSHPLRKKVGVMFETPSNDDETVRIIEMLNKKGFKNDDVNLLLFIPEKSIEPSSLPHYTLKDIKWAGYASNEIIKQFVEAQYEYFYYLCPSFNNHQRYILAQISASLKAGVFSSGVESYLDLILERPFLSASQSLNDIENLIIKLTSHAK